eukprot:gene8697-8787_t
MYLIVIAWTYVTLMMAVAESTSPQGTVLGAIITFALYGLLPMGILVYILGTPSRKRKIKEREAAEQAAYDAEQAAAYATDAGAEPAAAPRRGAVVAVNVRDAHGTQPQPGQPCQIAQVLARCVGMGHKTWSSRSAQCARRVAERGTHLRPYLESCGANAGAQPGQRVGSKL